MIDETAPTAQDVWGARARLAGRVRRTPLLPAPELGGRDADPTGAAVWIKDETRHETGSFKVRGATNALLSLPADVRARGVVAVSTGNHGRAVAHVARSLGVAADVFVSTRVPVGKLEALRAAGARLHVLGDSQDEAEDAARRHAAESDGTFVSPFDHPDVIAGQGTCGVEIVEDLPDVAQVVVPLSGGGLIAGVALAVAAVVPSARIVGVSMEQGAVMHASLARGAVVALDEADTLADSLQGGLGDDNRYTFAMVRDAVDATVLVPEADIARAMRHAFVHHRIVLEGGGAAALAAVLGGQVPVRGPTVVIASGANVDAAAFARVLGDEHGADG